jgi:hypothetical protein
MITLVSLSAAARRTFTVLRRTWSDGRDFSSTLICIEERVSLRPSVSEIAKSAIARRPRTLGSIESAERKTASSIRPRSKHASTPRVIIMGLGSSFIVSLDAKEIAASVNASKEVFFVFFFEALIMDSHGIDFSLIR